MEDKTYTDQECMDMECMVFDILMSAPNADEDAINATLGWMRSEPSILAKFLSDRGLTIR